jgi:peptidoglycan/LPS O-acetylase OafA/YrhL
LALGIGLIARHGSLQKRLWAATLCLLGVVVWGIASRYWGNYYVTHPSQTFLVSRSKLNVALFFLYGSAGKFLEDFAIGMLICLCYSFAQYATSGPRFSAAMRRLSIWMWRLGILELFFMALWHFNADTHELPFLNGLDYYYLYLNEIFLSIGFGLCVTAILFGSDALKRPFEWAPLRWVGLISFSLYIWHLPFLILFMNTAGYYMQGWNKFLAYSLYWWWLFLIIIPFSFLFYVLIEKPWMKVGDRLRRRMRADKKIVDIAPTHIASLDITDSVAQSSGAAGSSKDTVYIHQ